MLLFKARIQQKQHMSLHLNCATSEWHIQSCNLQLGLGEVIWLYCSFFIQTSSRITPPCPLSLKYEPPPPPSPFSLLKSTGHVCFIRNDKCCTLAVLLPTSHLSWLATFYSCQLFHLKLTQTPRKSSWWGKRASLKCVVEAGQ